MNIYLFRGKSATGKTTLSNILSQQINVPVLRKDDIFDAIFKHEKNISTLNSASYDILASQIQTCIDNGSDVIADIALCHTPSLLTFLNKIDFHNCNTYRFFCDCSDTKTWLERWSKRLSAPLPNQYFGSIDEIVKHYNKCDIAPQPSEIVLDSIFPVDNLITKIMEAITQ